METNFNFKSSVCTSLEQSERLLALGLKKETADMGYVEMFCTDDTVKLSVETLPQGYIIDDDSCIIPAWSLHRLLRLIAISLNIPNWVTTPLPYDTPFDDCIERIEHLIKEGYFNKEYLNGTTED